MINLVTGSKTLLTVTGVDSIGRSIALANPETVAFSVDNPEVATITADGAASSWLSGIADGTANVTVTYGELIQSVPVTVSAPVAVGLVVAESAPVAS